MAVLCGVSFLIVSVNSPQALASAGNFVLHLGPDTTTGQPAVYIRSTVYSWGGGDVEIVNSVYENGAFVRDVPHTCFNCTGNLSFLFTYPCSSPASVITVKGIAYRSNGSDRVPEPLRTSSCTGEDRDDGGGGLKPCPRLVGALIERSPGMRNADFRNAAPTVTCRNALFHVHFP